MAAPRILTFLFHEPYLCLMARIGLPIEVGLYAGGPLARQWQRAFRPKPAQLNLVPEEQWRRDLATGAYDVAIAQTEHNALDIVKHTQESRTPLLIVCHNRRSYLETTIRAASNPADAEVLFGKLAAVGQYVFISDLKRRDYRYPGKVVYPGIDTEEYGGYTGEKPAVLRVGNLMRERDCMFDVDFQDTVCRGFDHTIAGVNPGIPGARPAQSFADLLAHYRTHRCYLHVTREAYEDGYNLALLEAMAVGMPIVTLANNTSPIVDGEDGFVAADAETLRARIQSLMDDPALARAMGRKAREKVARRFPIAKFAAQWRSIIDEAVAARQPTRHPIKQLPRLSVLVDYVASPITTGRYFEAALRKDHKVATAGFRVPEELLRNWGFPTAPPPYPPHEVDLPLHPTCREMLERLPPGFQPSLYLWIDSGPKEAPPGLDAIGVPKICYLIDSHIAPEPRIAIARWFDYTFLAQKAQVDAFRRAGVRNVAWLPLACSPELHRVGEHARRYDVAFVGQVEDTVDARRRQVLDLVRTRFANTIVSRLWPDEMALAYAQAKIVVNCAVNRDVNMRVFEAMASGALLVTDDADGLEDLFAAGTHYVRYGAPEELEAILRQYLEDDAARERIARAGQAEVLARHTYDHRVREMLESVLGHLGLFGGNEGESRFERGGYYRNERPEVIARVPKDVRRVLDIGCGAGEFGRALKERSGVEEVVGVEIVERAYATAQDVLDRAFLGSIEEIELPYPDGYFDCITCNDVLEHLAWPDRALKKLLRLLKTDGVVMMSLPNIRFYQTFDMLAQGFWRYEDAGIMDRTHLRFFTAQEIAKLIEDLGMECVELSTLSGLPPGALNRTPDRKVRIGRLVIEEVSDQDLQELATYQWMAIARKVSTSDLGPARRHYDLGDYRRAYKAAERACDAEAFERLLVMGRAAMHLERYDEAHALFKEALALRPGDPLATGELGLALSAVPRPREALPLLEAAFAALPSEERFAAALGRALADCGDEARAYAPLAVAMEASFDHEDLAPYLVRAATAAGRLPEAVAHLRAYAEFYPAKVALTCALARVLLTLGATEEARERLDTLRLFAPDNDEIAALLSQIEGA